MPYLRRLFRKALQHTNDLDFEWTPAETFYNDAKDTLEMNWERLEMIEVFQSYLNEFNYEKFWEDCLEHQDQIYVKRYEGGRGVDRLAWGTPRTLCERWLLGCAHKADGWVLRQILTHRFFTSMDGL
jgi:hypothetical protein